MSDRNGKSGVLTRDYAASQSPSCPAAQALPEPEQCTGVPELVHIQSSIYSPHILTVLN